jgi:uncharacterized glyoxalase superfamily protein PhnB
MTTSIFNLSPVFRYTDAPAAMDWLVRAFGFTIRSDHRTPDGGVAHADLLFGSNSIGVSSASMSPPGSPWARVRQGLYVCVSDPDAAHDRAVAAGAEIVSPLEDHDYGSRDFTLRDPGGHLWAFGTYDTGATAAAPAIWPELQYADASGAVSWLERALGLHQTLQVPDETGALMHAELRLGETVVMLGPASARASHAWGDTRQVTGLRVDDPDAHHARSKAAGATIVGEPATTPYGARFYAARDPEGFLWWVTNYRPK